MTFRSSHIYNDYMNRQHKVRQADTQYARIKIRRVNQHYSKFYWSGNKGISTKSKYSQFNNYKNKYKKDGYHAWTVWHIEQLPVQNVMKDKTYTYKINNEDADKDIIDTSKTKTTKATNTDSGTQKTQKTTTTTTSNNTTITITKDVSYEGKPKTTRDTLTMTRKKKDYGIMEITYYAPENGWYNFEVLYGATVDCKLDNNFYIDNKLQKRGRDWTGYREVMNRHINHIKLSKGTHTITWKFDSRTIIYALGVKKIEVFEADTFNEKPLTLYNFDLSKTDELNTLEATINLFVEPFMFDKGKPYFIEENYSNLLFDYRDELNIYAKDNTGKERQLFGGYISSISLDDDGMIMELKCADRLIDLQNKYNLTQLNYNGGNNDDSKKEYTLSKQRYFIKYGDVLDFLTESVEVPLKNNVNDKTGTVFGEAVKDTGFHVTFNDDKTHFKKIKDTAKNMDVSTDSSNTKTRTKYMQLRNKPEVNKHQEVTLFNYDTLTNKQGLDAYCINKNPYLTVKYAMGDPKSTYKVCTSSGDGSDVTGDTNGFGDGSTTLEQISAVAKTFHYGGMIGDHDPIHAWNVYHMNKGMTGDCYDVTAWAYYVYNFKAGVWARDIVGKGDAESGTHHVIQIRSNGEWIFPSWYHECATNLRLTDAMKNGQYHVARDVPTARLKYPSYRNPWYGNNG